MARCPRAAGGARSQSVASAARRAPMASCSQLGGARPRPALKVALQPAAAPRVPASGGGRTRGDGDGRPQGALQVLRRPRHWCAAHPKFHSR